MTLLSSDLDYGNPGALTLSELAQDPSTSPFNSLDRTDDSLRQAALHYRGALAGAWSIASNVFVLDRDLESLTTGRSAPLFGGFFLDSQGKTYGSTAQVSREGNVGGFKNSLAVGTEWLRGDTDSLGFSTLPTDLDFVDRSSPSSDNTTKRTTSAFYVQDAFAPSSRWSLTLGVRHDRDETEYDGASPSRRSRGTGRSPRPRSAPEPRSRSRAP